MAAVLPESAQHYQARIEACLSLGFADLEKQASAVSSQITELVESMAYSSLNGGKRLRAALVYLSANCCAELSDSPITAQPTTIPGALNELTACDVAATAIELIHCYSLVHDDLPAMDDDDLRRGKPTNHKVYGEANAILAGDALQARAFEILAQHGSLDASLRVSLMRILAAASGTLGMVGGQCIDLALTGRRGLTGKAGLTDRTGMTDKADMTDRTASQDVLTRMHQLKTGALISAATQLGGVCAGASHTQLEALAAYGRAIGLAFQIQDDLLDLYGDSALTGKQTGMDVAADKTTFPAIMGEQATREAGEKQYELAIQSLQAFDSNAEPLRDLARYIIDRDR